MKRSGYRTIFHIYLIFFISLLGAVLLAGCLFFLTITVQMPDGRLVRSDWPKDFTESFREEIIFADSMPQIKQTGMESLQENEIGIQLLDPSGREVFSYQEPEQAKAVYSGAELLRIAETGKLEAGEAAAAVDLRPGSPHPVRSDSHTDPGIRRVLEQGDNCGQRFPQQHLSAVLLPLW